MESIINDIFTNQRATTGSMKYLRPADFEFNKPYKYRIIGGNPSRTFWKDGAVICRSYDGLSGDLYGSCAECRYMKGVGTGEHREYCALKSELLAYGGTTTISFTIPFRAQQNLHTYVKGLLDRGLDIPDVYTEIIRIEDADGYQTYVFSMDSLYEESVDVPLSGRALQLGYVLRDSLRADSSEQTIHDFATTLGLADKSISYATGLQIAERLGANGVVK